MYSAGLDRRSAFAGPSGSSPRAILLAVDIEGLTKTRYIIAAEEPILEAAADAGSLGDRGRRVPRPARPARLGSAPLRTLWGFDYLWEVYVPEPKRRWGYYVLPILFGDRFVGRIEPRLDRKAAASRSSASGSSRASSRWTTRVSWRPSPRPSRRTATSSARRRSSGPGRVAAANWRAPSAHAPPERVMSQLSRDRSRR